MRILFILLMLLPIAAYGQISKPGVEAQNGGSVLGRALSINCDNNCIVCTLTGTTMNITFSNSCGSSSPQFLLLENNSNLLLETTPGGKMQL